MKKICAVLVTYNPNVDIIKKTIKSLEKQVEKIIIVDNSDIEHQLTYCEEINVIRLGGNYGISYAQNRGIEYALKLGFDYILLSDQDTEYPENYLSSFNKYIESNLADVYCPVFYDNVKNEYSPIMIGKFKSVESINQPTFVAHAIASGTIISKDCLDAVGLMKEDLFIDYVDFEWCWRATFLGKKIVTIPEAIINHQLGDGVKKVLFKNVTLRSNMRYYYIIRNGFYLAAHCEYLSKFEKYKLYQRSVSFFIGVILLKHDWNSIKLCLRALKNGVKGKLGANF